jgi:dTDP-4-dehydrorhamnose 3,5-epimerase
MKKNECSLDDLQGVRKLRIDSAIDNRGFTRKVNVLDLQIFNIDFKIDSHLLTENTHQSTTRGIHLQVPPFPEEKIVWCPKGEIYDVLVDFRIESQTYGKWATLNLGEEYMECVYLPPGIGHAYQTLKSHSQVAYLISGEYSPRHSLSIDLNDTKLEIHFPETFSQISERDKNGITFDEASFNWNFKT